VRFFRQPSGELILLHDNQIIKQCTQLFASASRYSNF
jgi:hypothetical protein